MKKIILASVAIFMMSIGIVVSIYTCNDHVECGASETISHGENGEKIATKNHVCKEKYNL